ncbi:hypothetical protein [Kallotenue papyrolyticum]|uniref:hypothetical protein n=1 Tax=Kallotenue papyrolyticum TaxID=1325125 RepID=UPI000492647D|nr:hypothetical protein [Kallotenue papyrolyticum]
MNRRDAALAAVLEQLGITITRAPAGAWGWAIHNAQIRRDWQGDYPTPAVAAEAALAWLLEQARRGVLCRHLHGDVPDDMGVPLVVACDQLAWSSRN